MAFPTVHSVSEQAFASASKDHNVTMPATVVADDLLILAFSNDNNIAQTTPSGWTALAENAIAGSGRFGLYVKKADGTEDGTSVNVRTEGAITYGVAQTFRISGWGGTLADDVDFAAFVAYGAGSNPDPPSVTAGWGADDNLFIALSFTSNDDAEATAGPSGWSNLVSTLTGAGSNNSSSVHTARLESTNATENPGAFTLNTSDVAESTTIVIKPATVADTIISAGTDSLILTEYQASTSLDVEVNASIDALILTEQSAEIVYDVAINAGIDSLTLTTYQSEIVKDITISAGIDSLSLTSYQAEIVKDVAIDAGIDNLILTEYQATIDVSQDTIISANVDNLVLTEYQSSIQYDVEVNAGVANLNLTTYAASLSEDTQISAGVANLVLTEYQSEIVRDVEINAGIDSLVLTTYPASLTEDIIISAGIDNLLLTEYQANVLLQTDTIIEANLAQLTITSYYASVTGKGDMGNLFRDLMQ